MSSLIGIVIGVEDYDDNQLQVSGPCCSAVNFTEWLLGLDFATKSINLFVSPRGDTLTDRVQSLVARGVKLRTAIKSNVDGFLRDEFDLLSPTEKATLVLYCSGHGFEAGGNRRVLLLSDFTSKRNDRIVEVTRLEQSLIRAKGTQFPDQYIFCDMCAGSRRNIEEIVSYEDSPVDPVIKQSCYYATPLGKKAKAKITSTEFTENLLNVIGDMRRLDHEIIFQRFREHLKRNQLSCDVSLRSGSGVADTIPGDRDFAFASAVRETTEQFVTTRFGKTGLTELIADPSPEASELSRPNLPSPQPICTTQQGVFEALSAEFATPSGCHFTITGHAGVGKSTVMMALAKKLSQTQGGSPLTILITFNAIHANDRTLDLLASSDPQQQVLALFSEWGEWIIRNGGPEPLTPQWLLSYAKRNPVLILLDGVDDLLARNAKLSLSHVVSALAAIRQIAPDSVGTVVTLRKTQPGIRMFAKSSQYFEIVRIAEVVASRICPKIRPLLNLVGSAEGKELLLTPLLFFWIIPRIDTVLASLTNMDSRTIATRNRAQLMESILQIVLENGAIARTSVYSASHWLDALSIIAWAYHSPEPSESGLSAHSSMRLCEIQSLCVEFVASWAECFGATPTREQRDLLDGFNLSTDETSLATILGQTIFFPSYGQSFQFMHRDWHDLLVARYFRICLDHGNVREWGRLAHSLTISAISAQLMGEFRCPYSLAKQVIGVYESHSPRNVFIVGNFFGAIAANPLAAFEPGALDPIFSSLDNFDPFTRTLVIAGVANRILLTKNWHQNRAAYLTALQKAKDSLEIDAVSKSAIWCFIVALQDTTTLGSWPDLTTEQPSKLCAGLCTVASDKATATPRQRSLQIPVAELLRSIHLSELRSISTVHFLVMLSAVAKCGALTAEAVDFVAEAVSPGSRLEGAIEETFPKIRKELGLILEHCRQLWSESAYADKARS